jgi:multiple sugar transport system permease protein/raffinose/stachyose/melibiose transport system permease protein
MAGSSLKSIVEMLTKPFQLPASPQWGNFTEAWQRGVSTYLLNSVFVTGVSVLGILITSGLAAYALARLKFTGRRAFFLLLVTGYAIPIQTVLVPLYELLREARLLDSYWGLIFPYVAFGVPFSIFLLYAFFLDFPKEIEEAARLDGCNDMQILWKIVTPLSLPALASVAIFQGVAIWNEFVLALIIINTDSLKTLPLGLQTFQGQYATDWPNLLAAVIMATLPILVLFIVLQRQFVRSLAGFAK